MIYYSIHFNRPDFIRIQNDLAKKFNDKLVIINNGSNKEIEETCIELGLDYYNFDSLGTDPSRHHGGALNFLVSSVLNFDEDWGILDHDMFILKKIYLDCDIISMQCNNVPGSPYLWPGLILGRAGVNLSDVDFTPGKGVQGDTGSDTYRKVDIYDIDWITEEHIGDRNKSLVQDSNILTLFKLNDELLGIHYLNGSNWTKGDSIENKNKMLYNFLYNI